MELGKKQKTINNICEEVTDARIEELLRGKDNSDVLNILVKDLNERNPEAFCKWDEIYAQQPSYKDLICEKGYGESMRDKYIKVYKMCIELVNKSKDSLKQTIDNFFLAGIMTSRQKGENEEKIMELSNSFELNPKPFIDYFRSELVIKEDPNAYKLNLAPPDKIELKKNN